MTSETLHYYDEYEETYIPYEQKPLPVRSNYKEILTFEEYEFTQCMVYEMAIRNPRYKSEVDFVMNFYNKHKADVDDYIQTLPIVGYKKLHSKRRYISQLIQMISNIDVIPFSRYDNELQYKDISAFGKEFYILVDSLLKLNACKTDIKDNAITVKTQGMNVTLHKIIEKQGYSILTEMITDQRNNYVPKDRDYTGCLQRGTGKYLRSPEIPFEFARNMLNNVNPTHVKLQDRLLKRTFMNSSITVKEKFKRPKIKTNSDVAKNTIAEIDLSRPEKEIIAYIKLLKKDLKNEVISPSDIINSLLLDPCDALEQNFTAINKDKSVQKTKILEEMLFVYDYVETTIANHTIIRNILQKKLDLKIASISESNNIEKDKTNRYQEVTNYYKKAMDEFPIDKEKIYKLDQVLKDTHSLTSGIDDRYQAVQPIIMKEKYLQWISDIQK